MSNATNLKAEKREVLGKKAKNLRKEGKVPAELYGHGFENIHVSVPEKDFMRIYKEAGGSTIVNVSIDKESMPSLIYDVQMDPISQRPLSIDLYRVRKGEKLQTEVPLSFVGESPVEKDEDFVLVKVTKEVEVESTPSDLPSEIEVDISTIKSEEDSIHIKDLKVPSGVEILDSPDNVVVTVSAQREEVEEVEEEPLFPEELELGTKETPAEGEEGGVDPETEGGAEEEKEQ